MISPLLHRDRLDDPLTVLPERRSFLIAPSTIKILEHPERTAVNGQTTGMLEIRDKVNWFKPINTIQGVGGLGIKVDNLKGDGETASTLSLSKFSAITTTTSSPQ